MSKDYSAETGAALDDSQATPTNLPQWAMGKAVSVVKLAPPPPSPGTFATIALDRITPSLTNPRKTFDPAKLQDLAESIRSSGVHQPVVVRSLPGSRLADTDRTVQYELVVGERRLRASIIAGVDTIPAIVRTLSDNEVLEVQCVENLHRDDLAPLEEAEGYDHLMQHTGLSADEVAAKIGKSRSYVYAKLKLLDLCQEVRQALREGSIDASRALLIARIPDGKLQLKALSAATAPQGGAADAPGVRGSTHTLAASSSLICSLPPPQAEMAIAALSSPWRRLCSIFGPCMVTQPASASAISACEGRSKVRALSKAKSTFFLLCGPV